MTPVKLSTDFEVLEGSNAMPKSYTSLSEVSYVGRSSSDRIIFYNTASGEVTVNWIDFQGKEVEYNVLMPG